MMEAEKCIACGMPMRKPEDHPGRDSTKNYCVHCARPDGSMQSYQEKLESFAKFVLRTQGLDEKAARSSAAGIMATLPAWKK
jgi:hypothetical protein